MTDCVMYHDGNRQLQDEFGSRPMADHLEAIPGSTTSPLVAALRCNASSLLETSTKVHRDLPDKRKHE